MTLTHLFRAYSKHAGHAGSSEAGGQHIYMFQLQLQDATGSLLANVYGSDGDTFFTVEKVLINLCIL